MRAIVFGAVALCLAAPAVQAQPAPPQQSKRFARADADHDGRVNLQEFQNFAGDRLMKAKGKFGQKFRSLDPEQQAALLEKRFHKLDRDNKGFLLPADLHGRHDG